MVFVVCISRGGYFSDVCAHFSVIVRSALQVYGEKLIRKRGGSREMKGNSPRESSTEKPEGREERGVKWKN